MTRARRVTYPLALVLIALALSACDSDPRPAPTTTLPAARPAPTLAALGELEYPLSAFDGVAVRLHLGRFEAAADQPPAERIVADAELHPLSAVGDLDGDGSPDAAVVIAGSGGGSGTFLELLVVLNSADGLSPRSGPVLGDRLKIERLEVRDGSVTIAYLTAKPDEPLCCPTQHVERSFRLEAGRLTEIPAPTSL